MALLLQPASRESLGVAGARLDTVVDGSTGAELGRLGEELFAVLGLLLREVALRRQLADPAVPATARSALADRLLAQKVGRPALDTVSELVAARWSRSLDLVDALESLARRASLAVAEKDGTLDDVEDELFRFGRVLDREPRLNALLGDLGTPAENRVGLLREVLGDKPTAVTAALLEQTVRSSRGRSLDLVAAELSELAAERRDRYVAHVRTAVRLTAEQEQRLTDTLSRLYERAISLQIELDPDLLGGLVVRVGGELIDGSVAGRLATARRRLPS
ncbi:MAG: F0F1 ATP synthase subunit delta [Pseudonocardia sp.]